MAKRFLLLWACAMVAGCGGGSSSPKEKCEDFLDTVCGRLSTCLNKANEKDDCVAAFESVASCASVTSVTSSYDDCIDDVETASCDDLLDTDDHGDPVSIPPISCRGILRTGAGALTLPARTSSSRWRMIW